MEEKEKVCTCGEDCECEAENVIEDPSYNDFVSVDFPIRWSDDADFPINNEEFARGVKDASYIAGMYSVLVGAGVPMVRAFEFAADMYSTDKVLDNNMQVSKYQAQANIDAVKKQTIEDKKSNI